LKGFESVYFVERLTCDRGQQNDLISESRFFVAATCRAGVHAIPQIAEVADEAGQVRGHG